LCGEGPTEFEWSKKHRVLQLDSFLAAANQEILLAYFARAASALLGVKQSHCICINSSLSPFIYLFQRERIVERHKGVQVQLLEVVYLLEIKNLIKNARYLKHLHLLYLLQSVHFLVNKNIRRLHIIISICYLINFISLTYFKIF